MSVSGHRQTFQNLSKHFSRLLEGDQPGDPHSPRDGGWWSHMGWLLVGESKHNNTPLMSKYAPDLAKDRFYVWLNNYHWWALTRLAPGGGPGHLLKSQPASHLSLPASFCVLAHEPQPSMVTTQNAMANPRSWTTNTSSPHQRHGECPLNTAAGRSVNPPAGMIAAPAAGGR
ncbi:MAG TPA: hypothetical protein VEU11_06510 [Terriglobales bacterium]|nr:hypothetical protein [Terriglobales bacterium]